MSVTPGAQIKCRICGESEFIKIGDRETCKYCGATYAVYDPGLEAELRMAESFREGAQFEVAAGLYNKIIDTYEGHDLSDAYWGLFLCEQQVMFETDANGVRFPSFYAVTPVNPEESESFSNALAAAREYAPDKAAVFCELCEKIGNAKELYRRIGATAKPFDIFICFKKTAADGVNYTKDWKMAYDLYDHLSSTYNVFFSDKTLANVVVHQYEPNIYYGLYTARVMLLLCSKREYLESQWVKNEWSRFYAFSRNHAAGKTIIPIFIDDFTPANLPVRLQSYQGYPADYHLFEHLTKNLQTILKPTAAAPAVKVEDEMAEKMAAQLAAQQAAFEKQMEALRNQMNQAVPAAPATPAAAPVPVAPAPKGALLTTTTDDFVIKNGLLKKYKGNGGVVVVPDGVIEIGKEAFYTEGTESHVSVVILPKGLLRIGEAAFYSCKELASVSLPEGLECIDSRAFYRCSVLAAIDIPYSVKVIGSYAFGQCKALSSFAFPDGMTTVAEGVLYECIGMTAVTLPASIRRIEKDAFNSCKGLRAVTIPLGVSKIEEKAFYWCKSLDSVHIPESVTYIGEKAFQSCDVLTTVTIPESVTSIASAAFNFCEKLISVTCTDAIRPQMKAALEYMVDWKGTFYTLTPTGRVVTGMDAGVPTSVQQIADFDRKMAAMRKEMGAEIVEETFEIEDGVLVKYNGNGGVVVIPDGVTAIGDKAFNEGGLGFAEYKRITAVTVPKGVIRIGKSAFSGCKKLISVTLPEGLTEIGEHAFSYCESLPAVNLPNSLRTLGNSVFYECKALARMVIPSGITRLNDYFFSGCVKLTSVTLPDTLTEIGRSAFSSCKTLTHIAIPSGVRAIGENAFWSCEKLAYPHLPAGITAIEKSTFASCDSFTEIVIPDGVTRIEHGAFQYCENLTSVKMGGNVVSVGENAFMWCKKLRHVACPVALRQTVRESIGSTGSSVSFSEVLATFDVQNGTLKDYNGNGGEVVIPEGVTTIGTEAFWDKGVTAITIPGSMTMIEIRAFAGCEKLERITVAAGNPKYISVQNCLIDRETKTLVLGCKNSVIPDDGSVTEIGWLAFADCVGLTEIKIPQSITVIGAMAFRGCHGLTSLEFPKSVTKFETPPIQDCPALERLTVEDGNPNYYSAQNCIIEQSTGKLIIGCKNSVIPTDGSVTSIYYAFYGCTGLTKMVIPEGVKNIEGDAFYGCTGLISLVVPKSVKYLGDAAFKGCVNLTEIDAPFLLKGKIKKHAKEKVDLKYEAISRLDVKMLRGKKFYE